MMTSLASDTSLPKTTKSEEVPETPEKNNANNETATTTKTFNPITDIIQTSTARSGRSKTKTIPTRTTTTPKSTSKIPHPLTTLLTNKTNQFRRSASLRLRGAKSNLFTNFNSLNTIGTMDTKLVNEVNTRTVAAKDDLPSTGRISPRRKLVLNSQNLADIGLTRSLSLRRNHHTSHKTDSPKDSSSPLKALDAKDNDTTDCSEREVPDGIANGCNHISDDVNRSKQTEIEKNMDEIVTKTANLNTENMSLNLNGATSTSTQSRPATLATGKVVTTTASSKTATTPKTPKTPTTTPSTPSEQQLNNQNSHSKHLHHHHHHCTTLPSVPETKLTPKTPPVTPDSPSTYLDDDLDSLYSFATTTSGRSTMSCEHPYVARNGTTFSGRKMKYVVHCSNYAGQVGPDYLTPTQRAQRQIRRLKELLCVARHDLEQKDSEILRLTREVVELRLFKASLSSPEERSASSDAVTVRENELKTSQDVSPIVDMVDDAAKSSPRHHQQQQHLHNHHNAMQLSSDMQSSFADSGHFEDMTSSSVHSKEDSYAAHHTHDMACGRDEVGEASGGGDENEYEVQRQELIRLYEQRIEELIRNQDSASSEMKRSHNDKVEALLQKLAECNTRYADIVPDYEHAKERIRELEKQLEDLQRKLAEHEEKQNKMYLHMYQQGQEAERIARADQALELAHRAPNNKVSINELLQQLQSTQDELENIRAAECRKECGSNHALLTAKEAISLWVLGARKTIYRRLLDAQKNRLHVDPEVTLQFLKSAVYYFLTDKENSQGHLQAIESILEFTEAEKLNIKARTSPK